MNDYLTVKQVADKGKVTQQYIYKQLNNKFNKYLKAVNGKKYLHIDILNEFEKIEVEQPLNNNYTNYSHNH